ncbi:hypothetical protein NPIL_643611 [Nephila pilipes]|uniref:Uncharacterized protein n=1 Tax=Nephila pilipes TaxID=299642 RepID=A0A8X6QP11_NEPPI|nr:hypothetical protein NPIL_643611 [Nephila pilipes]
MTEHEIEEPDPQFSIVENDIVEMAEGEIFSLFHVQDNPTSITFLLKRSSAELYFVEPYSKQPSKVILKGLPATIDIESIHKDLGDNGFSI